MSCTTGSECSCEECSTPADVEGDQECWDGCSSRLLLFVACPESPPLPVKLSLLGRAGGGGGLKGRNYCASHFHQQKRLIILLGFVVSDVMEKKHNTERHPK